MKCGVRQVITIMSHIMCKRIFKFESHLQLLTKYQIFKKLPQISLILKNQYNCNFLDFFHTKFVAETCKESYISFLPVVSH